METELPDHTKWRLIETYLDEALDLSPPNRQAWLTELERKEPEIASTIGAMLAERDALDAKGFLSTSPVGEMSASALGATSAGAVIGTYTIETLIGRGGMGEVWLASRNDGRFEGRYAIKFLDYAKSHRTLAERFLREGRLLARLTHPNIARLCDAGTSDDGKQYLVLEYVDGQRIDAYCKTHVPAIAARVRLFVAVVAAVAHAHSHLIIHRDLKPSNVMVTKEGVVKLLDFGIAKLLRSDKAQDDTTETRAEEVALTPEYAAPEQLLGEPPSTATDVYQLGMLLFVLLTDGHPLLLLKSRMERVQAALAGAIPRASAFAEHTRRKELRGDLDAILARALQTDPKERYPTAAAFAEELDRYLHREPVSARRGAAFYRTRKFVARHRLAALVSGLAIAGLCVTSVLALQQARRATAERDRALTYSSRNKAITDFLSQIITQAGDSPKPVPVSEMLARSEKMLLGNTQDKPENRAAIFDVLASHYHTWGDLAKAAELDERALALLDNSHDLTLREHVACGYALMISRLDRRDEAIRMIHQQLGQSKAGPEAAAECLMNLASIAARSDDGEESLRASRLALDRFRESSAYDAFGEAQILGAIAYANHLVGQNGESTRLYAASLQRFTQAGRQDSSEALAGRNNWALVLAGAGDPKQALRLYDELEKLVTERDPSESPPATIFHNRARALELVGRFAEAQTVYERAVLVAGEQKNKSVLGYSLLGLGSLAALSGDKAKAADYLRRLTETVGDSAPTDGPLQLSRMLQQGKVHLADGKFESALELFTRVQDKKKKNQLMIDASLGKAETELRMGDATAAAADARTALDVSTALQGGIPHSNRTGLSWLALGLALQNLGDHEHAHAAFDAAVVELANTVDADHPALLEARRHAATAQSQTH